MEKRSGGSRVADQAAVFVVVMGADGDACVGPARVPSRPWFTIGDRCVCPQTSSYLFPNRAEYHAARWQGIRTITRKSRSCHDLPEAGVAVNCDQRTRGNINHQEGNVKCSRWSWMEVKTKPIADGDKIVVELNEAGTVIDVRKSQ